MDVSIDMFSFQVDDRLKQKGFDLGQKSFGIESLCSKELLLNNILYVQEVVHILSSNLLYKMGHYFLDTQYKHHGPSSALVASLSILLRFKNIQTKKKAVITACLAVSFKQCFIQIRTILKHNYCGKQKSLNI